MNPFLYQTPARLQRLIALASLSLLLTGCAVPMTTAGPARPDNDYRPDPARPQQVDFLPQAKVPTAVPRSVAKNCNGLPRQGFVFRPENLGAQNRDLVSHISNWGNTYIPSCAGDATYVLMRWQETLGLPVTGVITQTDIDETKRILSPAREKAIVAGQSYRDRIAQQNAQKKAEAARKEEAIAYKSFFGIPLGESRDFYRTNYSNCSLHKRCVGMQNDILNTHKAFMAGTEDPWDYLNYVVLSKEIVPAWLVPGHGRTEDWEKEGKVPFLPIPNERRWTRLHGVSFEVYKEAAVDAFVEKYGKPARSREIRTSSERHDVGGVGVPLNLRRLSERADVFVWQNTAVIAELACFSDNMCDGVIVTKDYWSTFTQQRKQGGGKL